VRLTSTIAEPGAQVRERRGSYMAVLVIATSSKRMLQ
jgi:hypothetical protein